MTPAQSSLFIHFKSPQQTNLIPHLSFPFLPSLPLSFLSLFLSLVVRCVLANCGWEMSLLFEAERNSGKVCVWLCVGVCVCVCVCVCVTVFSNSLMNSL